MNTVGRTEPIHRDAQFVERLFGDPRTVISRLYPNGFVRHASMKHARCHPRIGANHTVAFEERDEVVSVFDVYRERSPASHFTHYNAGASHVAITNRHVHISSGAA